MKRCPECRRDYYDDSLLYCLDDGNALAEGPATPKAGPAAGGYQSDFEPPSAILQETASPSEAGTRIQKRTAEAEPQSASVQPSEERDPFANTEEKPWRFDRQLILALIGLAVIVL